jgi:hypothetical protein
MGLGHGAGIVRSGLVLHLDAANRKSYPGSGTAWNDLTSLYNTTTSGGVTYNSSNNGFLTFNGTDGHAFGQYPVFSANSNITIEAIVRLNNVVNLQNIFNHGRSGNSFSCGMVISNSNILFRNTGSDYALSSPQTLLINTWYHLVLACNETSTTGYVNSVSNGTTTQRVTANSITDYYIGRRSSNSATEFLNGQISTIRFYFNKTLSATEVRQNFNATRGRYGI